MCLSPPEAGWGGRSPGPFSAQGLCLGLTDWESWCLCPCTALPQTLLALVNAGASATLSYRAPHPPECLLCEPLPPAPLSASLSDLPQTGGPKRVRGVCHLLRKGFGAGEPHGAPGEWVGHSPSGNRVSRDSGRRGGGTVLEGRRGVVLWGSARPRLGWGGQ